MKELRHDLEEIKRAYSEGKDLVIYGAGKVGKQLFKKLCEKNINIKCFMVTDSSVNSKEVMGLPIVQIEDSAVAKEKTLILVAVKKPWNDEIKNLLKTGGTFILT